MEHCRDLRGDLRGLAHAHPERDHRKGTVPLEDRWGNVRLELLLQLALPFSDLGLAVDVPSVSRLHHDDHQLVVLDAEDDAVVPLADAIAVGT